MPELIEVPAIARSALYGLTNPQWPEVLGYPLACGTPRSISQVGGQDFDLWTSQDAKATVAQAGNGNPWRGNSQTRLV